MCGTMSCMMPAMAQTGCEMHNGDCLCKNEIFLDALYNCVPTKCSRQDYHVFTTMVNLQCKEKAGFHLAPKSSKGMSAVRRTNAPRS